MVIKACGMLVPQMAGAVVNRLVTVLRDQWSLWDQMKAANVRYLDKRDGAMYLEKQIAHNLRDLA